MGWESHPPTAEGTVCVMSCARQLYSILLSCPQIRTSYLGHLWPFSVVLSPSKDPPSLSQAPQLASSSSSQELASVRGRWGSEGEEGED